MAPRIKENTPLHRNLVLVLLFGVLLGCFSCTPTAPPKTPAAPVAANTPATTAPAAAPTPTIKPEEIPAVARLSGEKTANVDVILELLASLWKYEQGGRQVQSQKVGFELPASAVNEYLAYSLRHKPRPGITAVTMEFMDDNRISTVVAINFDVVKDFGSWKVPDLVRPLLRETRTLQVDAHFIAADGAVRLLWDKAIGPDGMPITPFVSGLVRAIGLLQPEACDTDAPIPLPFGLKRIWTKNGMFAGET